MRVIQSPTHFVGAPFAQGGLLCLYSAEAPLLEEPFYVSAPRHAPGVRFVASSARDLFVCISLPYPRKIIG